MTLYPGVFLRFVLGDFSLVCSFCTIPFMFFLLFIYLCFPFFYYINIIFCFLIKEKKSSWDKIGTYCGREISIQSILQEEMYFQQK